MSELSRDSEDKSCPWVVFRLKDCQYAISSEVVSSIGVLPSNIVRLPNSEDYVRGIIHLRGEVINIIDLRGLFHLESLDQEYQQFRDMLDQREEDHINWLKALEASVRDNTKFNLATDPEKCAFGKWYSKFRSNNPSVNFHMKKIDEPHRKLHHIAIEVESCKRECDKCSRSECLRDLFSRTSKEYVGQVVNLLEEAKEIFRSSYKNMMLTLDNGKEKLGIMVDEVLGVEELSSSFSTGNIGSVHDSRFIGGIAGRKGDDAMILIIDHSQVYLFNEDTA